MNRQLHYWFCRLASRHFLPPYAQSIQLLTYALGTCTVWAVGASILPSSSLALNSSRIEQLLSQTTNTTQPPISAVEIEAASVNATALNSDSLPLQRDAVSQEHRAAVVATAKTKAVLIAPHTALKQPPPIRLTTFLQQRRQQTQTAALLKPTGIIPSDATSADSKATDQPIAAAGPENFNPELRILPPSQPLLPPSSPPQPAPPKTEPPIFDLEPAPLISFQGLQVDFRNNQDNFGQRNQFIESTLQFRFGEEPAVFQLKTGFNTFEQRKFETVTNSPVQLGWQTQFGQKKLQIAAGVDLFNRLPTAFNFNAQVTVPLNNRFTLFGVVEQGPYKANAETLENQITAWRFGPNIYWQIDLSTSFFSSFRLGLFNDGNRETQSFSRLEHRIGQFYVAANVFSWIFSNDRQEVGGYFSPPDFLVYNGEVGWAGNPFEFLRCQVNTNLGQQRLAGRTTNGNTYQARCTAKLSQQVELDFSYAFTNVANRDTGGSVYSNRSLLGQLRIKF